MTSIFESRPLSALSDVELVQRATADTDRLGEGGGRSGMKAGVVDIAWGRTGVQARVLFPLLNRDTTRPNRAWDQSDMGLAPRRSVFVAGERLSGMAEAWEYLTPQGRNEMVKALFEGVRVDVVGREVDAKPAGEFAELFGAARALAKVDGTPERTRTGRVPSSEWFDLRTLGRPA